MRQRWDCLAAERRVSWDRSFWAVSGSRVVAISGMAEEMRRSIETPERARMVEFC